MCHHECLSQEDEHRERRPRPDECLGIVAGVVTFAWPGLTALSLLYLVAFWSIAMGTFQVVAAVALRRELDGEFWMALGGVVSTVFGTLLVAFPGEGLISLVWLVGIWSVVFGVSSLGLAYRLHEIGAALPKPAKLAAAH